MADEQLYILARTLLDETETRLTAAGRTIPGRSYVHVGSTAHDCDQLTVEIGRVFPGQPGVETFGLEDREPCVGVRTAEFFVELVRCFPTSQSSGAAPTSSALDFASQELMTDGFVIVRGLSRAAAEHLIADTACDEVSIGTLSFPPPEGASAFVRLPVQVLLS